MEKHEFKPKEWVLTRDNDDDEWTLNIFSHMHGEYFYCVSTMWEQCIPYDGNEHLIGTSDSPEEKKTDGWKVGDKVEVLYVNDDKWYEGEIVEINTERDRGFFYSVRAKCFILGCKWCRADQLRKPEEKPEEKPNEEFKFGDKVKCNRDDTWVDGLFVIDDDSVLPYLVFLPEENDIKWCRRKDVRHA